MSWHKALPAIAAALAAVLVYCITLWGTYVYDDVFVVHGDPRIFDPRLWSEYWTRAYMPTDKLYRPLASMSFAIEYWLHGDRPWAFHAVNVVLHACVSAAVAGLARRLAGVRAGWVAGLLFAVHPVHVEAVAGLVGRSELMCALATVMGLCLFIGGPLRPSRIAGITSCFAVALLSKEQGLLFPLLLLALTPLRSRVVRGEAGQRNRLPLVAAVCYLLAGYICLREFTVGFWWDRQFLEWVMNPLVRSRGMDRLLMPVVLAGRYLRLLVFPSRLSIDYGGNAIGSHADLRDPYLYVGFFAVAAWAALATWSIRGKRYAALFCLLGFALTYGMVGNVAALIGTILAERLVYLPSMFFLVLAGIALDAIPGRVSAPLVIVLAIAGAWRAETYARLWNTPTRLFEYCRQNEPGSERVYALMFQQYKAGGQWAEARQVAGEAVRATPESHEAYEMCAEADLALGDVADARRMIDRGLAACTGNDRFYLTFWQEKVYADSPAKAR